jgi:hypothetical protein
MNLVCCPLILFCQIHPSHHIYMDGCSVSGEAHAKNYFLILDYAMFTQTPDR